jgi:hypothetical protein
MAAITSKDLREKLEQNRTGLAAHRKPWEAGNEEVARFTLRFLSPYVSGQSGRTRQQGNGRQGNGPNGSTGGMANNRLFNSQALRSHRVLSNGMSSGMSSPSQQWFKYESDTETNSYQSVKEWLDTCTTVVTDFLASTNIYQAMQSGYKENALYGSEAGLFVPHWKYGAVAYPLTWGEYWIGGDDGMRIDTLYRHAPMTVGQAVSRFGKDKLSQKVRDAYDKNKIQDIVPIMHAIEPNEERLYGKIDKTNKPFRSIYWEAGEDSVKGDAGILSFEGFDRKPFYTPRWETEGLNAYGTGPGFDVLPDARKIQLQEMRLQAAMDYLTRPALSAPVGSMESGQGLIPGSINFSAATDMGSRPQPIWEMNPQSVTVIANDIDQRTSRAISEGYYEPLFMAITQMQGVQPRNIEEIARRHEEQLSQLGPVVDRVQVEKLSVIVMQAFDMCAKLGMLPPVPDELQGREIKIKFTSVLAQAQRMIGLAGIERAVGFAGNLAGSVPTILDNIDFDDLVREYWERVGVPAKTLRSIDDVQSDRQARAQQEQSERMAAMAPALKDVAQGAELLSKTDVGGSSLLEGFLQPGV